MISLVDGLRFVLSRVGRNTFGIVAVILLVSFFARLVQVRTRFRRKIKQYDIPTIPHSFLLGHLVSIGKVVARYPSDFSKLSIFLALAEAYPEVASTGVIYLDSWPFGDDTLAVLDPDMIAQFTQERSLLKHPMITRELGPMTQCNDLVTMEGSKWKKWRAVFNPGFSAKNLTALVPAFLEEIQVLKEILSKAAESGKVIRLEDVVQRGTVDVICRAALGIRLHSQTTDVPFVKILQNQITWLVVDYRIDAIIKTLNPMRYYKLWDNNRRMKNFLAPLIEKGVAEFASSDASTPKTINFLAVKYYMAENAAKASTSTSPATVDPLFLKIAIAQLKIFIFAGHDTTASTLSFAYSRLYRAPAILAALRAEHDEVLGPDPKDAFASLSANPSLLNQLPYTSGVVKETLRLYPPAGTARIGAADVELVNPATGKRFPTAGHVVFGASFATHRLPAYWARPDEFLPERWLAREGDALYPRRNAWRPFEHGPRNCIGQELAQMEMRAILAMTVRELEFESAYPEGSPEVFGEKAYQTMTGADITGHVKGGFPVRIRLRKT